MYGIYKNGELIGLTQTPHYVYKNKFNDAWVATENFVKAKAIAVCGILYNIFGKDKFDENAPVVLVKEIENGEVLFNQGKILEQQKADLEYIAVMAGVDLEEGEVENGAQ